MNRNVKRTVPGRLARFGRRPRALPAIFAMATMALAMSAATASAVKVHPLPPVESFGSDGSSLKDFKVLNSLALRQSPKRLFAFDIAAGLYGFDVSSPGAPTPLTGFNPKPIGDVNFNNNYPNVAVDDTALASAGNVYYATKNSPNGDSSVYGFNAAGSPLPGWPISSSLNGIFEGVAVDPDGNVWFVDRGSARSIREYSPSGEFRRSIDISAGPQSDVRELAFDSNGDLYAFAFGLNEKLWKYTAPNYAQPTPVVAGPAINHGVNQQFTLDRSSHTIYIGGNQKIQHFSLSGTLLEEFGSSLPTASYAHGIAIDEATGDAYVSANTKIYRFAAAAFPLATTNGASGATDTTATLNGAVNLEGVPLTNCHFEYVSEAAFAANGFSDLSSGGSVPCAPAFGSIPVDSADHPVSAAIAGLDEATAYRFRLVAANANGSYAGGSVPFRPGRPIVETTGSPLRAATVGHLEGRVYPHGLDTTYYFEYGDQGPCDANPCIATEPHPAGSKDEVELVSQRLTDLEPGATYHYRVVADNGNPAGSAVGGDMTLETLASDAPLSHGHLPGPPGSDRAWEQVNASDTGGNPVLDAPAISDDGTRAIYHLAGGSPISETGTIATRLFAERTPTGWQTKKIYATRQEAKGSTWKGSAGPSDLSELIDANFDALGDLSVWRMTAGNPAIKLYSSKVADFPLFVGASDDGSRALAVLRGFQDPEHPASAESENLYDITSGSPELIGLLPNGDVPACGVQHETAYSTDERRSTRYISADGSLTFFLSKGNGSCSNLGAQQLYMRDIDAHSTTLISTPPVSGPECTMAFIKSTPGAVFFYTKSNLVAEDTTPSTCGNSTNGEGEDGDVYRYDIGGDSLDCVTCSASGVDADVSFSVNAVEAANEIGVSEDGSHVYFHSLGRLLPGAASRDGSYGLDLNSGALAYLGHVSSRVGDSGFYGNAISADGSVIVFRSSDPSLNPLGGPQNGGTTQYYRYDDRDHSLVCVSCPSDGSAPRGEVSGELGSGGRGPNTEALDAAGGDLAFTTPTPLVGADQNTAAVGQDPQAGADVYEWRDGRLSLVTDGLTNWPVTSGGSQAPKVSGITPDGHDIFFAAAAQYTPDALDGYVRLYDARIGGGFEFPQPPKPCPLEVCQGTPRGAPEEPPIGTSVIHGAGNPSRGGTGRCSRGKVRRNRKCVAKPHRKRHKQAAHPAAGRGRGGSR